MPELSAKGMLKLTCKFLTRGVYNRSVDITLTTVTTEAGLWKAANNFPAGRQDLGIEGEAAKFFSWRIPGAIVRDSRRNEAEANGVAGRRRNTLEFAHFHQADSAVFLLPGFFFNKLHFSPQR